MLSLKMMNMVNSEDMLVNEEVYILFFFLITEMYKYFSPLFFAGIFFFLPFVKKNLCKSVLYR